MPGTLNYTSTRTGYALLRQWLLRPSLALDVIAARHDAIECFLRADNLSTCGAVRGHLKGVRSVPQMLLAMKRGRGEARDWETMCKVGVAPTCGDARLTERAAVLVPRCDARGHSGRSSARGPRGGGAAGASSRRRAPGSD